MSLLTYTQAQRFNGHKSNQTGATTGTMDGWAYIMFSQTRLLGRGKGASQATMHCAGANDRPWSSGRSHCPDGRVLGTKWPTSHFAF